MGDLSIDTALEPLGDGRFRARLSREWEIWGPMGGYVAAVALRAAGATSPFDRPATFYCHYLGVADFDTVDLEVTTLRSGRTAISQRVSMHQGGRAILDATVWSIGATDGLEHDEYVAPDAPAPNELKPREDLPTNRPTFPFWDNVEMRAVTYSPIWPPAGGPSTGLAGLVPFQAAVDLRGRPLARRCPGRHPPRYPELAGRQQIPRLERAARVHRTEPRRLRRVPRPGARRALAPRRRLRSGFSGRVVGMERPAMDYRQPARRIRWWPGALPEDPANGCETLLARGQEQHANSEGADRWQK